MDGGAIFPCGGAVLKVTESLTGRFWRARECEDRVGLGLAQRLVVPVPAAGTGTVDIELPPGIYRAATKQLDVTWGPLAPTGP